jgi:lactoylglutathione lyase
VEADYAKWHLENPRLNFAISSRGSKAGIDHLGFQADTPEELVELKARAEAADAAVLDEGATTCCYARSEKHWVTDPQGIAWEHFQTLADIPVFSESQQATPSPAPKASACCVPRGKPVGIPVNAGSSCC